MTSASTSPTVITTQDASFWGFGGAFFSQLLWNFGPNVKTAPALDTTWQKVSFSVGMFARIAGPTAMVAALGASGMVSAPIYAFAIGAMGESGFRLIAISNNGLKAGGGYITSAILEKIERRIIESKEDLQNQIRNQQGRNIEPEE